MFSATRPVALNLASAQHDDTLSKPWLPWIQSRNAGGGVSLFKTNQS